MVNEGDRLPAMQLRDASGAEVMPAGPMVMFFYPKADTPGCTTEALEFTAARAEFVAAGYRVFGVSRDSPAKLEKFATKHGLTVELLSDEAGGFLERAGVWVEKQNYGRSYMGIERTTMLVDASGTVLRIWRKVRVKGHVAAVLAAAESLPAHPSQSGRPAH